MQPKVLFLEASDDVLVRRQEAARRPHPLQAGTRLLDGIAREREMVRDLRGDADVLIDTTNLNVHQLAAGSRRRSPPATTRSLRATVVSFGFKYGIPVDADMVLDMRFLPNPHWVPELRPSHRHRRAGERLRPRPAGGAGVPRPPRRAARDRLRRVHARAQALPEPRDRLHGRQAPQRGDGPRDRPPAAPSAASRRRSCTATWVANDVGALRPVGRGRRPGRRRASGGRARRRSRPRGQPSGAAARSATT